MCRIICWNLWFTFNFFDCVSSFRGPIMYIFFLIILFPISFRQFSFRTRNVFSCLGWVRIFLRLCLGLFLVTLCMIPHWKFHPVLLIFYICYYTIIIWSLPHWLYIVKISFCPYVFLFFTNVVIIEVCTYHLVSIKYLVVWSYDYYHCHPLCSIK